MRIPPQNETSTGAEQLSLAAIRDRFAALILDVMICSLMLWSLGIVLAQHYGGIGISVEGIDITRTPTTTAILVCGGLFLYFFVFESMLGATAGKLLCHLSVRRGSSKCGLAAALVRTMCRPVDALIGLALMRTSDKVQRMGDKIAGTTVVRLGSESTSQAEVNSQTAGWEGRTKAALIDLAILTLFVMAYLFATSSIVIRERIHIDLHRLALLVLVELSFLYFVALEGMFGGTVGKLACNIRVVRLNRTECGFVESTIRTCCRLVDVCSAGLLPFLFVRYTSTQRHLGDRLAGTIVIEAAAVRKTGVWTAAAICFGIATLAAYPFWIQSTARYFLQLHR